jgi:hypothetical protein
MNKVLGILVVTLMLLASSRATATVAETSEPLLETKLGVGLVFSCWALTGANVVEGFFVDGSEAIGALGIAVGAVTLMVEAVNADAYDRSTTVEVSAGVAIAAGVFSLWRSTRPSSSPHADTEGVYLAPALVNTAPGVVLRVSF